jgi:hypothetical protein
MKWMIVALLAAAVMVSAQNRCNVQDFYGLAHTLHNPSDRHSQLSRWLTLQGPNCSAEQLVIIWNGLAGWAGAADSAELRQKIIYLYEKASAGSAK